MSRIGTSLLALAVAGLLVGGSALAQTNPPPAKAQNTAPAKAEVTNKKMCKQQAADKHLTGPEKDAFEKSCYKS
jgi:hypothetical protein